MVHQSMKGYRKHNLKYDQKPAQAPILAVVTNQLDTLAWNAAIAGGLCLYCYSNSLQMAPSEQHTAHAGAMRPGKGLAKQILYISHDD